MTFPSRVAIATKNPHKIGEIREICRDWPVEWVTSADDEWPDVEEPHDTYLDNALTKARFVADALGLPAIADDSGIEVDALEGGPGPRSARFAGEDATAADNLARLIERVREVPPDAKTARYRCVAACAWPGGRAMWAEGTCEGSLVAEPRGSGGFGYDPIFVPQGLKQTMAELAPGEKHRISHRGKAFRALGRLLAEAEDEASGVPAVSG
jgi:XTP/dITP diphosphohydrolase